MLSSLCECRLDRNGAHEAWRLLHELAYRESNDTAAKTKQADVGIPLLDAAIEAIVYVGHANWDRRQQAAREWIELVASGGTDKSLDDIQEEVNSR